MRRGLLETTARGLLSAPGPAAAAAAAAAMAPRLDSFKSVDARLVFQLL